MILTTTQLQTLKAAIAAETNPTLVAARTAGATGAIADWYNLPSSQAVWRTDARVYDIFDSITWTNYTPTDAVPSVDNSTQATSLASIANIIQHMARSIDVQTKQMNLQNMLIGKDRIDESKANIRAGLRDAVIQLPTGASGAATSAGGTGGSTVLAAGTRFATNAEKLYATVDATTGPTTAKLLVVEGTLSNEDVVQALSS